MVPVSLFIWLVLEIAAYLAIGRIGLDASWSTSLLGAIGGILGLRAGINATTWMFSLAHASPAPKLGFIRRAWLMFDEYLGYLFTFLLVIPFEWLWMPADRLTPKQPVIVLVHGYGVSRGVWWQFRRYLEKAGYTVATVSLIPPFVSIGKLVPQLNQRIEEVCAATGNQQIILLGHSMGGLVCRSYLARHGITRVSKLITVASPHAGTELARVGMGQNGREMEPDSLWLRDLASETIKVPAICLRNPYDNYVMPQDNQRLPGAEDVEMPAVGHVAMLNKTWVAEMVLAACRRK